MQISLTLGLAAFAERIQRRRLGPSDFSKSFAGMKEEGKCSLTSGSAFVADRHFLEAAALYKENGADDLAPFVCALPTGEIITSCGWFSRQDRAYR